MSRLLRWTAVVFALAASGCATLTVSSHVERGWDFTPYQTFDWGPADALPTGDPRLDKDPFFQDHVAGAVEKQMALKGFEQGDAETADLLIHYHANISTRIDVNKLDSRFGYCSGENCNAQLVEYEAGTLVIDIVDAKTSKVIWRGWAQDTVKDVLNNQGRMARRIDEAVRRMLENFPQKKGE
jgi:hypothetical protein